MAEIEATPGVSFADLKYSGVTLIEVNKLANAKVGDKVAVETKTRVYGPYILQTVVKEWKTSTWYLAIKEGGQAERTRPMTKAEVEAQNITLLAELEKLRAQVNGKAK